ncbi:MAG TPA: iron ABC transporter permease [Gammaproteobacteria bacterium]|nr:iron ABC transporter permease [Gammaproteobacteria bacterium]
MSRPQVQTLAHPGRRYGLLIVLGAIAGSSFLFALLTGSVGLDWQTVWGGGEVQQRLILELRLARAINAFACGGLLALAGALLQVLLRNPLADPYILGVSGGASVGALLALLLGLGGVWMTGSAFAGAMLSIFLVFALAHGRGESWTPTRLLLTGVVIAAGWGALISFILVISPDTHLRGMLFWLMGDLSQGSASLAGVGVLAAGLVLALPIARDLNVLVRGDMRASALGVPLSRLRLQIYVISALLTATAVTFAGNVGFVGLIVPHFMRLLGAHDHRILLPACVLAGGSLVIVADTLARTLLAPQQLPVGIVTALIGVPVFLYLLHRNSAR